MAATDEPLPLDYTPDWITLGIVSAADIRRDQHEASTSGDPHPEHYRWRAFSHFLSQQRPFAPSLAEQLYALGAADADSLLGGSIMAAVLRHPDCPPALLQCGLASKHAHLRLIATQRLHPSE
ncbi:MAG: hypothetical protein P4L99_13015 [Chthoniobacter sp.]|nr:hypothetical protein [Chthoniobacter sp.]